MLGYYKQCRETGDTIAHISKKYFKKGITNKSQKSIIKELLEQNIINEDEYNDFMKVQQPEPEQTPDTVVETPSNQLCIEENHVDNDIKSLKECLYKENKGTLLLWLQRVLMEACFVKLCISKPSEFEENNHIKEPSTYHYARKFFFGSFSE